MDAFSLWAQSPVGNRLISLTEKRAKNNKKRQEPCLFYFFRCSSRFFRKDILCIGEMPALRMPS